jgi:hypothetical protein
MGINGWDRIHRTLGVNIPQDEVVVGIPGYTLREDNSFWNALLMPFRKQRDYWLRPDGTQVGRQICPRSKIPPGSQSNLRRLSMLPVCSSSSFVEATWSFGPRPSRWTRPSRAITAPASSSPVCCASFVTVPNGIDRKLQRTQKIGNVVHFADSFVRQSPLRIFFFGFRFSVLNQIDIHDRWAPFAPNASFTFA